MAISSILLVRTDAIGDNVLFSAILPHLTSHFPDARFTIVCQEQIASLYEHCPLIHKIIPFSKLRAIGDLDYREEILRQLRETAPDLCLNTIYSRDMIADEFALGAGAKTTIAFRGCTDNIAPELLQANNAKYSQLVDSPKHWMLELDRFRSFLTAISARSDPLQTQIWTSADDRLKAAEILTKHKLHPAKLIAVFAGAQFAYKNYDHFGKALANICREKQLGIVALGGEGDIGFNMKCLDLIPTPKANLCGRTTLLQATEILRLCRVAVGTDTGLAHVACAVGTQQVIALGGGHFGRFFPYSPLTSIVSLPLECFGCNWRCKYLRPHCVKDIAPEVIELAVRNALDKASTTPRGYFEDRSLWKTLPPSPTWAIRPDLLPETAMSQTLVTSAAAKSSEQALTQASVNRRFHQPLIVPWMAGVARLVLRPIARRLRGR